MNGISHSWNGTVLTITSDSGTSSCDLKGEKGDDGVRGAQGIPGEIGKSVAADATLSVSGQAADAKVTGDKINALQPIGQLVSGSTKPVTSGAAYNLQSRINTMNPSVSQLQSATDGTLGRVSVFSYGNDGIIDFTLQDNSITRLVLGKEQVYSMRCIDGNWQSGVRYVKESEISALNTKLTWKPLTIPEPTINGTKRTYSIDLSGYSELSINIFLNSWGNVDTRLVKTRDSNNIYYFTCGYQSTYTMLGNVSITSNKIEVAIVNTTFPETNYPFLGALYAR